MIIKINQTIVRVYKLRCKIRRKKYMYLESSFLEYYLSPLESFLFCGIPKISQLIK